MHKGLFTSLIPALLCLLISCNKTGNSGPVHIPATPVFVVCEGSLGNGNSALTLYDADSNKTTEDIYRSVNNSSMGDIFQSITRIGNQYFLCINNSDKILVIDRSSLLLSGTIAVAKPRYILPVSSTKAYVSSLFGNRIFVINPQTAVVTDTIIMPFKNPEAMVLIGNSALICTWDTAAGSIYAINSKTNTIERTISITGRAPQEIVQDKEGMIWVLSGNKASGVESKLTRLNPSTGNMLTNYSFGTADPLRLVLNNARDSIYFIEVSYTGGSLNNGVFRMGIHDAALPATPFIPAQGLQYFWGLGIHPVSGEIYVADPVGFTQRGKVFIYKPNGQQVMSFSTGVGPGHFLFD